MMPSGGEARRRADQVCGELVERGQDLIKLAEAFSDPNISLKSLRFLAARCGYHVDLARPSERELNEMMRLRGLISNESQEEDDESWRVA